MSRYRVSILLGVAVIVGALVAVGTQASTASGPNEQLAAGSGLATVEAPDAGLTASDGELACTAVAGGERLAGGNPCKSCPQSLLPACTRVSCDACCFQCPNEPFLRCL